VAHDPTIDDVIERSRLFRGRDVATSLLPGGHANGAYVVQVGDTRYVVRIPGVSSELLVPDRANERHNTMAAAAVGVSPRVVEHLDDWQVMVLEYVEGETLTDETIAIAEWPVCPTAAEPPNRWASAAPMAPCEGPAVRDSASRA
jgi:hypothetical protein